MFKMKLFPYVLFFGFGLAITGCKAPMAVDLKSQIPLPNSYSNSTDTLNTANVPWRKFFTDPNLVDLIDKALRNNQELQITLQEVEMNKNDIRMKNGAILPTLGLKAGAGVEKVGRYTSQGAGDATTEIKPGVEMPDPLGDFTVAAYANWEVDIWKKLRNSKKAAINRYLASVEGKNFMITNLVSELATSYFELIALDNQLSIVKQNIMIQNNALEIVKAQKESARATELGVQKFRAEVLNTKSLEFDILQEIKRIENRIHFIVGEYPQEIKRSSTDFLTLNPSNMDVGIPVQLLEYRPDVKQAELDLIAAKLDVKVARAEFYPSLGISSSVGFQAFKPAYLLTFPESLLYSIGGDLMAPLLNRSAIKAEFKNANARQIQALYNYQKVILNSYLEVSTAVSKVSNIKKSYDLKSEKVAALNKSIEVAGDLFSSARVDYFEVLMTQRDALESKLDLVDTKKEQLATTIELYKDLGGGWK